MVTSRQFARGMVRTMQAMDRAAKQAERQRIARQNALAKQAMLDASAQAVAEYEALVDAIVGGHRVDFCRRDWLATATAPKVCPPDRRTDEEDAARAALDDYKPGWFTRMLGREEAKRAALTQAIDDGRARDERAHAMRISEAAARNAEIDAAQRVVERDTDALIEALGRHSQLGDLPFLVEGMDAAFIDGRMIAIVDGLDLEDMPEENITLLKSGKASIKPIAIGKRHEMHRDAICSAAIRVAVECLSVLPLDEVEVLMLTDILDRATGHIAAAPVLHLRVAAQALEKLNLQMADAAALVERLSGHMDWIKRDDFRSINAAAFGIELP